MIKSHKKRTGKEANAFKHGHNRKTGTGVSTEYRTWACMKSRCLNSRNKKYPRYGGRGILVCGRWMNSFQNFLDDMGFKPSCDYSIERVNKDGNYTPENCIWATQKTQQRNRSTNRILTFNGVSKTMAEFSEQFGMRIGTLWNRLNLGWDVSDALTRKIRRAK